MNKRPFFKTEKKTVSLVLGSGGARGLAHIGVIHWLEKNGFEIKSIAGCSIGSLIGGVYAAGKLDQLEKWMRSLDKPDIEIEKARNACGTLEFDRAAEMIELGYQKAKQTVPLKV